MDNKMDNRMDNKIYLGGISSALATIHKMIVENEFEDIEKRDGFKIGAAGRLQLLLTDPEFVWLRSMSQLMAFVDEAYFQKESITDQQVEVVMTRVQDLLLRQSNSDFSNRYRRLLVTVPDLIIQHGHLKLAISAAKNS